MTCKRTVPGEALHDAVMAKKIGKLSSVVVVVLIWDESYHQTQLQYQYHNHNNISAYCEACMAKAEARRSSKEAWNSDEESSDEERDVILWIE